MLSGVGGGEIKIYTSLENLETQRLYEKFGTTKEFGTMGHLREKPSP